MKIFKQKRPVMQKWFSTRAQALVETQLWGGGDHRQGHPDDWAPALFTGSVTHRLLLIPNGKQGTGRPLTRTGDLQE